MYMKDWTRKLDEFIRLNDKEVLTNAGTISHEQMKQTVNEEFEIYQRKLLDSDNEYSEEEYKKALRKVSRPKPHGQR